MTAKKTKNVISLDTYRSNVKHPHLTLIPS